MEPFSIQCESCSSRLKVRKASAIGQILACPKCGHKIEIQPPGSGGAATKEVGRPLSGSSDANFASTADFEDIDQLLASTSIPSIPVPAISETVIASQDEIDSPHAQPVESSKASTTRTPATPPSPPALESGKVQGSTPATQAEPLLPDGHWVSDETRQRKKMLLTIGGAATGLVATIVMIGLLVSGLGSDRDRQSNQRQAAGNQVAGNDVPENEQDKLAEGNRNGASPVDKEGGETENEVLTATDHIENHDVETAPDETGQDESNSVAANGTPETKPSDLQSEQEVASTNRSPSTDESPDGFTFEGSDDSGGPTGEMFEAASVFAELDELGSFLERSPFESAVEKTFDEIAAEDKPDTYGRDQLVVAKPEPRSIDVTARLADEIEFFSMKGIPLGSFLNFVADFGTLSISVSPESLLVSGADRKSPVTVDVRSGTLEDVLRNGLNPIGMDFVVEDAQLVIIPLGEEADWPVTEYPVDDLLGDELTREQFTKLIISMVEPDSWAENGGRGLVRLEDDKILVRQSPVGNMMLKEFLARLRFARRLDGDSKETGISLATRWQRSAETLAKPLTVEFLLPERLERIVQQISEVSGVEILVDWRETSKVGWNIDTQLPFSANDESLTTVLADLVKPLELSVRIVDAKLFEITSPSAVEADTHTEFYPCQNILDRGVSVEDLLVRLKGLYVEDPSKRPFEQAFFFDRASGYLMARLNQRGQQTLEKLLASWNAELARGS